MSERIVNIHADGKLAYTGYMSRAAQRLNLTQSALATCINKRANLAERQPKRFYTNSDGHIHAKPPAVEYIATFVESKPVNNWVFMEAAE